MGLDSRQRALDERQARLASSPPETREGKLAGITAERAEIARERQDYTAKEVTLAAELRRVQREAHQQKDASGTQLLALAKSAASRGLARADDAP